MSVVADTHAKIWYVDAPNELSTAATSAMDVAANTGGEHIFISAITLIEMRYLVEKIESRRRSFRASNKSWMNLTP